jgi:hypothetical protein
MASLSFPFIPFPFLSFHIISLLTSTGQTGKSISMVDDSNDAFPPKEVPFWGLVEKIGVYGVNNPQKPKKVGVVYGFPAKLGESIKTHMSVKSRDVDTKFERRLHMQGYSNFLSQKNLAVCLSKVLSR